MSRKLSSPTAHLLRGSRLFSLPPPLRLSEDYATSADMSATSDTATTPFPTRQAIATPTSSLHRGDWGLKRPLPLRETTRSSTPTMRVHEVDTINLFTDFESAGDHVQTLHKWQELNIPLSIKLDARNSVTGLSEESRPEFSVFEERTDNTELPTEKQKQGYSKWKFQGPWIAAMDEGEFQSFLETRVRGRKQEFREYLREEITRLAYAEAVEEARETGAPTPVLGGFSISDIEFEDNLKRLREDTTLNSNLSRLISDFFDLPGVYGSQRGHTGAGDLIAQAANNDAETGPPCTHPSAGLSYLRSSAFLHNHPILGPQSTRPPVQARILATSTSNNLRTRVKVGLGGVVVEYNPTSSSARSADNLRTMKLEEEGGPKVWVTPTRAYIDSRGHIRLTVKEPVEEDVQIKQGNLKSETEMRSKPLPRVRGFRLDERLGTDPRDRIVEVLKEQTSTST